jgi:hypothetical protein
MFVSMRSYIPVQQHLSTSLFASLQNSLPFFCSSQQQVFTSLPVNVHFIAAGAADTTAATANTAISVSNFIVFFITSPPVYLLSSFAITTIKRTKELFRRSAKPTSDNQTS